MSTLDTTTRSARALPDPGALVRTLFPSGPGFGPDDRPAFMGMHDGLAVLQSVDGVVGHFHPDSFIADAEG